MNFKLLLVKKRTLSELRISESRLFHSYIVEGKNKFFKEVMFRTNGEYNRNFLSNIWNLMKGLFEKVNVVTYFWLIWIINKVLCTDIFVAEIQKLSLDIFSFEVSLITPVTANTTFYWISLLLWWNEELYTP